MKRVIVAGDIMLDRHVWTALTDAGDDRPLKRSISSAKMFMGGAGNVAANVGLIGVPVSLFGVVGKDAYGHVVHNECTAAHVMAHLDTRGALHTTTKERFYVDGRLDVRVDNDCVFEPRQSHHYKYGDLVEAFSMVAERYVFVVSDYSKGYMSLGSFWAPIVANIHAAADGVLLVDPPRCGDWLLYGGKNLLLKPNLNQVLDFVKQAPCWSWLKRQCPLTAEFMTDYKALQVTKALANTLEYLKLDTKYLWITMGQFGSVLHKIGTPVEDSVVVRSPKTDLVTSTVGAGDVCSAVMASHLARTSSCWGDVVMGAKIATAAASAAVRRPGTCRTSFDEVNELAYTLFDTKGETNRAG